MPSAQPIITMISTKPKIGFSIDSIVGNRNRLNQEFHEDSNDAAHENLPKLPSDLRREYLHLMKRPRQTPSPKNIEMDINSISRLSETSEQDVQNNNNAVKNSPTRSPSPIHHKGPIMVPGLHLNRPPMMSHGQQLLQYPHDVPPGHPHFLQFQAAAALVHAQAAQTGFTGGFPQHLTHLPNPNMPRDSYPLYPWLLSRHGRIFPHRFPGSK